MNFYSTTNMKTESIAERLEIIRNIIATKRVANQEELAQLLNMQGIAIAQATLSRSLKTLKVMKTADNNGYYYTLPNSDSTWQPPAHNLTFGSIKSVMFSGQMCMIKTQAGFANGVAVLIDSAKIENVMGTIAGDDTIFLACKAKADPTKIIASLEKIFQGISSKTILE